MAAISNFSIKVVDVIVSLSAFCSTKRRSGESCDTMAAISNFSTKVVGVVASLSAVCSHKRRSGESCDTMATKFKLQY
jgi:hypothetical protein